MASLRRAALVFAAKLLVLAGLGSAQIMSVDLGHEFFKVALMRQGAPLEIVLNSHSKRKTTTAVSFFDASRTFGDDALAHQGKAPSKVPMFFHGFMGRNFTSAADVEAGGEWWKAFGLGDRFYSYSLGYNEERGVPTFRLSSENETSQEEVLANVFFYARKLAEETADGKKVRDLVVTVAPDANMRQRQAIIAAGEIAGCRVLTLVHEGSAFAMQRAVDFQPEKGNVDFVLFYNMGSRKTEVSIVKFESKQAGMVAGKFAPVVTVLGSAIEYGVGGHLMDIKIADAMLKRFQEKNPKLAEGIAKNARALRKLLSQAQKTKAVLSANKNAPFIVESLYEDMDFQATIKREEFQEMCEDMFNKMTDPVERALAAANVTAPEITMVEVVGGAWRVPRVQELLSKYIEEKKQAKIPLGQHINGEEGAALGAALVGANGSSSFRVKKIFFADVTAHEYSAQVVSLKGEWEKNYTVLFPVGSYLGSKKKLAFNLEEDFAIRLFENGVLVAEYAALGLEELLKGKWSDYNLTSIPKLTVSITLETNGIIDVKVPMAAVEESHWVNVTVNKPRLATNASTNTSSGNSSDASGDAPSGDAQKESDAEQKGSEEKTEEKQAEEKPSAKEVKATENLTESAIVNETEVIQKLRKKKHEKKLVLKRTDFRPIPMTEEGIAASKAKMEALAEQEQVAAKVTALKNELEAAIYGSRDKLESEAIVAVTTEEQREEVTKLCTDYEEWMYEAASDMNEYEQKLNKLKDLLGPMEERATEVEARSDLPEAVTETLQDIKAMQAYIAKNMSWVNESKTADAAKKATEFEEWWAKKQEQQAALPLHEAPAYTRADVLERVGKVHKEMDKLKKTKKPKEKKPKANATGSAADEKAPSAPKAAFPADIEATEKEIATVREQKATAVEKEDFDKAHSLKLHEKALVEHLAKLKAEKTEL